MNKIPVTRTIEAAYRFVLTHLGAIIGLIWLPMVLVTVIGFFVEQRYYAAAANALASNNVASLGPALLSLLCYFVAALLLYSVMIVPVVQLALGQRKEGALLHFAFGPAEWRLFRALVGLVAFLLIPITIAGLLFSSVLSFAVPGRGSVPPLAGMGLELLAVLAYLGILYIGLRFVFLLPAVAVSEEVPVLPRAWKLSAGNFWRILGVVLATAGPVKLIAVIAEIALEGPQALMPDFTSSSAMAAAQLHSMSLNMPLSQGIGFLIAPLMIGLLSSASVACLAALKDGRDATLPP
jgi:hypothetical protein